MAAVVARWAGLLAALWCGLAVPAATAAAQDEPRWALVIGNNDYRHVGDLGAAVNDAAAMATTLKGLGFEVLVRPNVTRAGTYRAVRQLAERAAGAVVIVYYAGHGVQVGGRNYLLPVDIEARSEGDVEDNAVPVDDVLNLLAGAKAKLTVAFLDACRDNPLPPSLRAVGRGMAQQSAPRGLMVVYSAGAGERAVDNLGRGDRDPNGLFVRELMPELRRPGVPLDRAVEAAAVRISEKAAAIGHDQNPAIYKAYYGEFYLRPGPASSPPSSRGDGVNPDQPAVVGSGPEPPPAPARDPQALDMAFWGSIEAGRNPADYEAYLEQFPAGNFARLARNRLVELEAASREVLAGAVPRPPAPVLGPRPRAEPAVGVFGGATREAGDVFRDCDDCPEMVVVPAGEFMMGSPYGEEGRDDDEGPWHRVAIARPFALGRYEVTFDEWDACVTAGGCGGYRPADRGWGRGRGPVIDVSWKDAQAYAEWLRRETGEAYRLPSEAEWEYAARAGTATPFWTGTTISTEQANYDGSQTYGAGEKGEARKRTVVAGSLRANPWGLHEVHGNVWEWVEDCYSSNYAGAPDGGRPWERGDYCPSRLLRGGSWYSRPTALRAADRVGVAADSRSDDVGFRVAKTLIP